ncbi:MAG: TrkH family potassium uptake protein [Chlamydiales bacterium]
MLYRDICRVLSFYLWILAIPLCLPLFFAVYCEWIAGPEIYPQPPSALAFVLTILIAVSLGGLFWLLGKKGTGHLYRREALLLVILVYLLTPFIGSLPFLLSRTLSNPIDAFFEATSGLTTTGATIMEAKDYDPKTKQNHPIKHSFVTGQKKTYTYYGTISPVVNPETYEVIYSGIEAVSPPLLLWRSFMQWLGGGGIIVLFVAILPMLGVGGKILFQTEVTGPSTESIFPRIKDTASQLWKVYVGLSVVEIFFLMITNAKMSLFDAVTVTFSTISTGGFTPKNEGIAAYQSNYTDGIIMIFMILGSVSFLLYFFCMKGKFSRLNDSELKAFLLIIAFAIILTMWQLIGQPISLIFPNEPEGKINIFKAFHYGAFEVISLQTSTGFSIANYNIWPFSVQVLLLVLMYVGGMAGSTAGGIKIVRHQTFFRILINKIDSIYRPDTVHSYRVGTTVIDNPAAITVLCFFMVAALLAIIGTFLFVLDGIDPETSLTSISCMMNNVGIAFRMGGPTESFAFLSNFGKIIGSLWMIAGRLEYFAILIAFVPAFWRTSY